MDESVDNALVRAQPARDFEGHAVTTIWLRGRPWWLASEIGDALGYADRYAVQGKISKEWAAELARPTDYDVITEAELAEIKRLHPDLVDKRAPSLMLLTESGVHLVAMLTRQPAGVRLRRWLAEDVLPALHRTGTYAIAAAPSPATATLPPPAERARVLRQLVDDLAGVDTWQRELMLRAAELETGENLDRVRDALEADVGARTTRSLALPEIIPPPPPPSKPAPVVPTSPPVHAETAGRDLAWARDRRVRWAWETQLPKMMKAVLAALASIADVDGYVRITQVKLASVLGVGEQAIRTNVRRLEEAGVLAIERHPAGYARAYLVFPARPLHHLVGGGR